MNMLRTISVGGLAIILAGGAARAEDARAPSLRPGAETATHQARPAAPLPARGFWYKGFRPTENPFQKPGAQYWVSPDGDDNAPGSEAQPWKTLGKARLAMAGGDIVNILPGVYVHDGVFGPGGPNMDKKTVYRAAVLDDGNGPANGEIHSLMRELRPRRVVVTGTGFEPTSIVFQGDNISLQGLWIGGDHVHANKGKGYGAYGGYNNEIVDCTFFNTVGIGGGPAYNWLFQNNRMVHGGQGHFGHSMYMAGGVRHDLPWNSRNLKVFGNIIVAGEGYAFHGWHSPVSISLAGNFSSGNWYSAVLQGANHACHHNVFWKDRGRVAGGDAGQLLNCWLPGVLRRFDHIIFGTARPVWDAVRSMTPISDIYLLYDVPIDGVPSEACTLLTGEPYTGQLPRADTIGQQNALPRPGPTTVRPAFFPRTDVEIDAAVAAISAYFREHTVEQIAADASNALEKHFETLQVQYHTTMQDYAEYPPMAQDADDATWGGH